jgi:hypothetical protein
MSNTRERIECERAETYAVGTRENGFVDYSSRGNAVQSYRTLIKGDHTTTLRKTEVLTITIVTEINDE